jgi:hypothetical protein
MDITTYGRGAVRKPRRELILSCDEVCVSASVSFVYILVSNYDANTSNLNYLQLKNRDLAV